MYACLYEIRGGLFDRVCTPSNATANFCDPPPPQQKTGGPLLGLRPEVGHAPL
jgi:hypothetical protein